MLQKLVPHSLLTLLLITVASSTISQGAISQQANTPTQQSPEVTWYTVEMILFRQGGNPNETAERWRKDIRMSYPLEWRSLIPAELAPKDDLITSSPESNLSDTSSSQGLDTNAELNEQQNANSEEASNEPALIIGNDPLVLLGSESLQLKAQAKKIQRNNRYRVLFHAAWHHPFVERDKERSIIIGAGDRFDNHQELEGSIELKLQRYLHLTTDLWLTQFATNFGEENEWPELPWPPNRERPAQDFNSSNWFTGNLNQSLNSGSQFEYLAEKSYIVKNIAPIQVTRRMRSNELHYIDHPLLGILIQFTPYTPPETVAGENGTTAGTN